jgi:hypothetical protein
VTPNGYLRQELALRRVKAERAGGLVEYEQTRRLSRASQRNHRAQQENRASPHR